MFTHSLHKISCLNRHLSESLAAEPRSSTGHLFSPQCPCGMILLTLYSKVWDWQVSRAGPMFIYWPNLPYPFLSSTIFPFLFFRSIGWYCRAGVFGLIVCRSLSPSLSLLTFFNNNSKKYIYTGWSMPTLYIRITWTPYIDILLSFLFWLFMLLEWSGYLSGQHREAIDE